MKEAFTGPHGLPATAENVYGVLSLVFWSLNFVISFKYIGFVMRADNRGEGGILALLALVRSRGKRRPGPGVAGRAGLFGAALLYGDGVITPAISVLGAIEGLEVAAPALESVRRADLGAHPGRPLLVSAARHRPDREGVWPHHAGLVHLHCGARSAGHRHAPGSAPGGESLVRRANSSVADGLPGFLILGAVVLVITGGEALYADMGHFGRRPIRLAWFGVALPALLLNYFGQAALLIQTPGVENPFFALVPGWFLYPMIIIAAMAAVVASQALISGAFSLTRQAVQLGYSPRVTIVHTSQHRGRPDLRAGGQPGAGGGVHSPGPRLPKLHQPGRRLRHRRDGHDDDHDGALLPGGARPVALESCRPPGMLCGLFLVVDLAFFGANIIKFVDGGWFPMVVAVVVYTLMSTWQRGRARLTALADESSLPIDLFLSDVMAHNPVPGAGHRHLPDVGDGTSHHRCCSITSSTTGRCTSGSSSCRS